MHLRKRNMFAVDIIIVEVCCMSDAEEFEFDNLGVRMRPPSLQI